MRPIGATSGGTGRRTWACLPISCAISSRFVFPQPGPACDSGDGWRAIPRTIGSTRAARSARRCPAPTMSPKDSDGAIYVSAGNQVLRLAGDGFATRSVFADVRRRRPVVWRFTPTAACWSASPAAGWRRSMPAGRSRWLNQVGRPAAAMPDRRHRRAPTARIFMTEGSIGTQPRGLGAGISWRRTISAAWSRCGPELERRERSAAGICIIRMGWRLSADGKTLWLTESWNHRLSRAAISGRNIAAPQTVLGNMPGYPARLATSTRAAGSGSASSRCARIWSNSCCARTISAQEMMADHPAGPLDRARRSPPAIDCHEPMQFGSIKALGIEKPWAPPRSYGLLVAHR